MQMENFQMICDVNVKPCIMLCVSMLFLSFHKQLSWMFPVSNPPAPQKKMCFFFFSVDIGREYFHSCLSEWHDSDWRRDSHGAKNKTTLNDRWLRTEVKVFNRRHSVQTAHCSNSTSPVELQYCLRTKMYAIGGRSYALAQASCVSGVFSRFFGSVFHLSGDLEWIYCKKQTNKQTNKHGKCSLCVR